MKLERALAGHLTMVIPELRVYRFADLDKMSFERVIELYSGAEWLAEQEAKAVESNKPKRGRR